MNKTVVVTGGTKGLGREISLAFGRAGFHVVALYGGDQAAAQDWTAALTAVGGAGVALQHDVASEDVSLWGRPEIQEADQLAFIHNACAPFTPVPMHQLTWQDFENNHRVAVRGAWQCSQPLIRLMIKRKTGVIIPVLSEAVEGPPPKGFSAYVTAKYALRGFTLALAAEYAVRGLKIFSVSPGFMDTALTRRWDERLRETIRGAGGRITEPAAAARRIVELATDSATPGTGENYPV